MNELQRPLDVIETEINLLKQQTAQNIIEIGKKELGAQATLKQICNHVGPQFGISTKDCLELIMHVKAGGGNK